MILRTKTLVDSIAPLNKLVGIKLAIETSYKIARIAAEVGRALEPYEKLRNALIDQYGSKDAQGALSIKKEDDPTAYADFLEKLEALQDVDVDVMFNASGKDITRITHTDLLASAGAEGSAIAPYMLIPLLGWLIDDDGEV